MTAGPTNPPAPRFPTIHLLTDIGAAASEHDHTKFALSHVVVVPDDGGAAHAIATDGRIVAITHEVAVQGVSEVVGIARDVLQDAFEWGRPVEIRSGLALSANRHAETSVPVLPPIADVIESKLSELKAEDTVAISINAHLLSDLASAISKHGFCTLLFSPSHPTKAVVVMAPGHDSIGLLMPMVRPPEHTKADTERKLQAALAVVRRVPSLPATTGAAQAEAVQP